MTLLIALGVGRARRADRLPRPGPQRSKEAVKEEGLGLGRSLGGKATSPLPEACSSGIDAPAKGRPRAWRRGRRRRPGHGNG